MRFFTTMLLLAVPVCSQATGLNFWESSPVNSALGSANGAVAVDASVLALAPSSMTQLALPTLSLNATRYQVDTDYLLLGNESEYSKSNWIPAGFATTPLTQNLYAGLAIYSRTAADISIPEINVFNIPFTAETRVRPISVSIAPSLAYRWGALSVAATLEYQYTTYLLEKTPCAIKGFVKQCTFEQTDETTSGWSGGLSATWQANSWLTFAINHKFSSNFGDQHIQLNLSSITNAYATVKLTPQWQWHNSYSLSRWDEKGIRYRDYSDPFGLLVGSRDSKRFASSMSYQWQRLSLRGGFSMDQAIDSFGGDDLRYRVGLGYQLTPRIQLDAAGFVERYAGKQYVAGSTTWVKVQNRGYGVSFGITAAWE